MSVASDYATQVAALSPPEPFIVPRMTAEVMQSGTCRMLVDGTHSFEAPPEALLAFAAWINATFGDAP